MSDLNRFLKVLRKVGYPNPSIISIAKAVDYHLEEFLPDLVSEIGEESADDFTTKALTKFSEENGLKVTNLDGDPKQYAYINIIDSRIDLENDTTTVLCRWSWGDTNILSTDEDGNETYKTIQELGEDIGMGDWAEYDELLDSIKSIFDDEVYLNCGFGIWYDG